MDDLSSNQKRFFIKRYVDNDIIDIYTLQNIYDIIKNSNNDSSIRNSKNNTGVFIDLNKVNDDSINKIYMNIKKYLVTISII